MVKVLEQNDETQPSCSGRTFKGKSKTNGKTNGTKTCNKRSHNVDKDSDLSSSEDETTSSSSSSDFSDYELEELANMSSSTSEEEKEDEEEELTFSPIKKPAGGREGEDVEGHSKTTTPNDKTRPLSPFQDELIQYVPRSDFDEYEYDSSDEEDLRNTIGDIPVSWYDDFPHIGYDWDGKKILKPLPLDELDKHLSKTDDANYHRTVHDPTTGRDIVLSDGDVRLVKMLQGGKYPDLNYNPYEDYVEWFSSKPLVHPLTEARPSKKSFLPSLSEAKLVRRMVRNMLKVNYRPAKDPQADDEKKKHNFYNMWSDQETELSKRMRRFVPAPKVQLPGHHESYNPPPEYLPTDEEIIRWRLAPETNPRPHFIAQKYSSLRAVPSYSRFIKERFNRCLDLFLCPRERLPRPKQRLRPSDLLPKLPKPKDLMPFPTTLTLVYKGHKHYVKCLSVEPFGQFVASGSEDCTVRVWEILTGRCLVTVETEGPVASIAWCPNAGVCVVAIAVNKNVVILNPKTGDSSVVDNTDLVLSTIVPPPVETEAAETSAGGRRSPVEWRLATDAEKVKGYRVVIEHRAEVKQVTWHCKGDYFASVMSQEGNKAIVMHQLTKCHSQVPFRRPKGLVQCVLFHPSKPFFYVATQRRVRIYNLIKQQKTKELQTNVQWVSSMAIHPGGDNVIVGSYDCRLAWFDLDLSSMPYQTLRHHKGAVRNVAFHRHYPLFASASDDGSVIVCHGMVYSDLLKNPLIVPVKQLRGHGKADDLSVLDCQFHPTQPWIFTAGADGNIFLYT